MPAHKGNIPWNKGLTKEGEPKLGGWPQGVPRPPETIEKIRIGHLGIKPSEKTKAKTSAALKGRSKTLEHNRKVGEANKIALLKYYAEHPEASERLSKQTKHSWENNPNMQNSLNALSEANEMRKEGLLSSGVLGYKHTEEWKKEASTRMKERWQNPEYAQNMSLQAKERWKNIDFAQAVMRRREKTGPEKMLEDLLQKEKLPYSFVGNGAFWIGKKNPDFIHDSDSKVIEVYGDFFHKGQNPQSRINYFRKCNYDCLVLWASFVHQFPQEAILKIKEFTQ